MIKRTSRGFEYMEFYDSADAKCSLQKSSAACDDFVWLGIDDVTVKTFKAGGGGWSELTLPEDTLINGRMHLDRAQALELSKQLRVFARTGSFESTFMRIKKWFYALFCG